MCELLAATAADPFPMGELWDLAAGMERYGVAGFGWGAAWVTPDGSIAHHVSTAAFRDDPAQFALAGVSTRALLVHLRRPSKLSTIGLPDAQPFLDPQGRFAFGHNGDLAGFRTVRPRYLEQGRIAGRADSEVGQRWLEDAWAEHELELSWPDPTQPDAPDPCRALAALHAELGGQANLMALTPSGVTHVHAGNTENPVFHFRLGSMRVASTALYSIDRSLFRLVAPHATDRHLLKPGQRFDLAPGA
jgi:glutamine phosphoribosylpyrophosphate amidotransferase